jgi:hypothetical protein
LEKIESPILGFPTILAILMQVHGELHSII